MSKIWKKPIVIPEGVEVSVKDWLVSVKWPKWQLSEQISDFVTVEVKDWSVYTSITDDERKNFRWLSRTLIMNMVDGVTKWYEKKLLVIWVWFNAKLEPKNILLSLWFSHKVNFPVPAWIEAKVEQDQKWNYVVTFNSIQKQFLWEIASKFRDLKKPEPYKWKWIRYFDEVIKLKAGKTSKK